MIKIVFLDFDQTLYSHYSKSIPASAVKALNILHDKGIQIFLSTGRSLCELDNFDISMVHIDGIIANNGQIACDMDGNIVFDFPLSGKLKEILVEKYKKKTVPMFFNTKDEIFANYINDAVIKTQNDINTPIPNVKEYNGENIYMCSAFYDDEKDWDDLLNLKDLANITYWHDGAVDIVPNNISKAKGVELLINKLNIKQEETMCFGDGDNDSDMIEFCNIGVAMGNATEKTKKVSDYVTDHIEENGIYNALKHYDVI